MTAELIMQIVFGVQLIVLSLWLPKRCLAQVRSQHPEFSKRLKQLALAQRLPIFAGALFLLLVQLQVYPFNLSWLLGLTALQVLLLLLQRQLIRRYFPATMPTQRRANLNKRTLWHFITPRDAFQLVLVVLITPTLAFILSVFGISPAFVTEMTWLASLAVFVSLVLLLLMQRALSQPNHNFSTTSEDRQHQIQQRVDRYRRAILLLNLLFFLLILGKVMDSQPALIFISISLFLQLLLWSDTRYTYRAENN